MKNKSFSIVLTLVAVGTFLLILLKNGRKLQMDKDILVVHAGSQPSNTDPIEFDFLVHHFFQKPLISSLVSEHRTGGITGIIAESWRSTTDQKSWTFKIRSNLRFSSGLPIKPKEVANSLTRMAYLLKVRNSKDGFFEHLTEFNTLTSPEIAVSGISYDESDVTLTFSRSMPNALHYLSFGQYAIVSPNDYDSSTGEWKDRKKVDASGPYVIGSWDDESVLLNRRDDFPAEIIHPRSFKQLKFVWSSKFKDEVDVREGQEDYPFGAEFRFIGHTKSDIRYIRVYGYENPLNPLTDKDLRARFRQRLLTKLKSDGFTVTHSFLPLSINGTKEFPVSEIKSDLKVTGKLRIMKYPAFLPLYQRLPDLMAEVASEFGIQTEFITPTAGDIRTSKTDPKIDPKIHLGVGGTGIVLDRPKEDLKFMVQSKEGIRLPDPTGRLSELVSQTEYPVQEFNNILHDDALIWPIMHVAGGIWVRGDSIDTSLLNPEPPPTDLSFLGKK